jgi:predicted metal-dependent hydrolase
VSAKIFDIPDVGQVHFYKRRGSKNIRLTVSPDGIIKVSLPYWVTYKAALRFVMQKQQWLSDHATSQANKLLSSGQRIGKGHGLKFVADMSADTTRSRITGNQILITYPEQLNPDDKTIQTLAHKACLRALKIQADQLLPHRLELLAHQKGFEYNGLTIRHLKSRWGSCNSTHAITLNYYLMQLPWELIDYVLIHELAHTKHLNHSALFWQEVATYLPNYRELRKSLRHYSPSIVSPGFS